MKSLSVFLLCLLGISALTVDKTGKQLSFLQKAPVDMFVELEESQAKPNPDPNPLVHVWVPKTPMWDFVEDKKAKPAPAKFVEIGEQEGIEMMEEEGQAKPNPDPNPLVHVWVPKTPMWDFVEDKKAKPAPAKFVEIGEQEGVEMMEEEGQAKPNPDPNPLVHVWVPKTPMWDFVEDKKSKPAPAPAKFVEITETEGQAKPNPDPNPLVHVWVPKTPMWDFVEDKKSKPAPAPAKLLELFEEMSEEMNKQKTQATVMLEQSYLNKVASDFLKHPASDKIQEAVSLQQDYTFLGLLRNTIAPFLFGDDDDRVKDLYAQCVVQLGPKYVEDLDSQSEIYNSLHDYCYKENREGTLFQVMSAYAHVFFKDLKQCHDIWKVNGIEREADMVAGQIVKLMAHMDGIDDYYDLHEHEITKENHADANPTDPAIKARLDDWLDDWNEVRSGWSGFKRGVKNLGTHMTNQVKALDGIKNTWDETNIYNSILRQHKENVLQALSVTAKYADFYCDNQVEVAHHLRKSLEEWNHLMAEYMEVTRDDKFP